MKVLVLGATGATGKLVVQQLIKRNIEVRIVVRDPQKVSGDLININLLEFIVGSISVFNRSQYYDLVKDCNAVISCLGHNITFRGLFGKPRLLVTYCMMNVCEAIQESKKDKTKVILMNTTANRNKNVNEKYTLKDRIVLSLLSVMLPPQRDNVKAAEYLLNTFLESNSCIEWSAVRPDTLISEEKVTEYEIMESPKRSPVFDAGKTSRINAAHFMVELIANEELWNKWKYKMPVIYNSGN